MRRSFVTAASACALLAGIAVSAPAMAQSVLNVGASVNGTIDAQDAVLGTEEDGQYRYEDYRFRARAGQRLEAIMRSDAFDTYLSVFRAGQEQTDAIAEDDDGLGDGTNSRLRFVAPADGDYTLRARTLSGLDGGAFTLSLMQRPAAPPTPRPNGIRIGQTVSGAIAATDPVTDDADEVHYDAYAFRANAGQRVAITLTSANTEELDPAVHVGRMDRGAFVELAQNDDGSDGTLNSYLIFTAPSSGEFVVRAMPLGADSVGGYTLTLADAPPPPVAQAISVGGSAQGELSDTDGVNDTGARADVYSFSGVAGDRIDATLNSTAFDPYLELFNAAGESLDQDDDGGDEGTNARLIATLPADGTYTLQARATGDVKTGAYTLSLAQAAPEPVPAALTFGQTVQGEIKADSGRDDDGRGYDAYSFMGTKGNRVQVIMRSGDFDTFLQVGRPGGAFEALASDDDGLGEGTDSRLNYTLPESGEYIVRASPLGSEEKGLYSIQLIDKGPQPEPGSILIGATARGTLSENDGISEEGAFFDAYTIQVAEGDKLEITLVSNDFDAYLDIGKTNADGTWESTISDDDSLSDTHAKVDWTVAEAGTYVIRARSLAVAGVGAYTLDVKRKP